MKAIKNILLYIIIVNLLICCANSNQNPNKMDVIKLRLCATPKGEIGYGYVFSCKIVEVLEGELTDSIITMVVMHNNVEAYNTLSQSLSPKTIDLSFALNSRNEASSLLPQTGFVDKNKTSWVLEE